MPARTITVNGKEWRVYPSGRITVNHKDEFGLYFMAGSGADRVVRVARYSPTGSMFREESLAGLTERELLDYFAHSQPSEMSPEAGYSR